MAGTTWDFKISDTTHLDKKVSVVAVSRVALERLIRNPSLTKRLFCCNAPWVDMILNADESKGSVSGCYLKKHKKTYVEKSVQ